MIGFFPGTDDYLPMDDLISYLPPVLASLVAGGLIGFEREFRGRPAGLRTHILVALASALLMLAAARQAEWGFVEIPGASVVADPTRMAHGILTGIGFLCAGVIFREGFSIHGLTTAASLWISSAIGVLFGAELYTLGALGVAATITGLVLLRPVERRVPSQMAVDLVLRYGRDKSLHEDQLRALMREYGFDTRRIGWSVRPGHMEHRLKLAGMSPLRTEALAAHLCTIPEVQEFDISPRDD